MSVGPVARGLVAAAVLCVVTTSFPADAPQTDLERETKLLPLTTLAVVPGDDGSIESPTRFSRSTYVWPYVAGPHYGIPAGVRFRDPGVLHTMVGSFRLDAGPLELPEQLVALARGGDHRHGAEPRGEISL